MCKRIDALLRITKADLIASVDEHKLVKLDFAIEGTKVGHLSLATDVYCM